MTEKTQVEGCPSFMKCSAPLCSLDPGLNDRIWYSDEPVCTWPRMSSKYPWLTTQRKIHNRCRNASRFFTIEMLERNPIVRKSIKGLNPEVKKESQLKTWLKNHPQRKKRKYTEEELIILRERMKMAKKALGRK